MELNTKPKFGVAVETLEHLHSVDCNPDVALFKVCNTLHFVVVVEDELLVVQQVLLPEHSPIGGDPYAVL